MFGGATRGTCELFWLQKMDPKNHATVSKYTGPQVVHC